MDVEVGVGVGVEPEVEVGVGVGVGVRLETLQVAADTVLLSKVTAPLLANTLPLTIVPVLRVIDADAKIFPRKLVFVPSVAELPTCQKTLHD